MTGFAQHPNSNSKAVNSQLKTKNESQSVVAANASRICLILCNVGAKTITVSLSATAVAEKGIVLTKESAPFKVYGYTGAVSAIAASEEPVLSYSEF